MHKIDQSVEYINQKSNNFKPKIGMILGSGLGVLADDIKHKTVIPYHEIPHFPSCSVAGHEGYLHLGLLNDIPIACLQGRAHNYEGVPAETFHILIRSLKALGCEELILTNAAGSLREDVAPGEIVLITDHINFQGTNPLVGQKAYGSGFIGMDDAYNLQLRQQLLQAAKSANINLHEGVYLAVLGPCFETPAEIRAFRILGADLVGMSTVPEIIVARHCGLKVAAISAVTNFAAGMHPETLSHEITLQGANLATDKMICLLHKFLEDKKYE